MGHLDQRAIVSKATIHDTRVSWLTTKNRPWETEKEAMRKLENTLKMTSKTLPDDNCLKGQKLSWGVTSHPHFPFIPLFHEKQNATLERTKGFDLSDMLSQFSFWVFEDVIFYLIFTIYENQLTSPIDTQCSCSRALK